MNELRFYIGDVLIASRVVTGQRDAVPSGWTLLGVAKPESGVEPEIDVDRLAQALLRAGLMDWNGDTIPPADELAATLVREYARG